MPRAGREPDPEDVRAFFSGKVASFAIPDRVIVEEKVGDGSKGKEKSHRVALKLHKEEGEGRP